MTDLLDAVAELLHGPGDPAEGFDGDLAQAEAMAILKFSSKPYCLVRDWMMVEIKVTDEFRASLAQDSLAPFVIYASNVVCHSARKRQPGDWVRSSFQREFADGYRFETRNTTYILVGPGLRKRVSAETILAIVE